MAEDVATVPYVVLRGASFKLSGVIAGLLFAIVRSDPGVLYCGLGFW